MVDPVFKAPPPPPITTPEVHSEESVAVEPVDTTVGVSTDGEGINSVSVENSSKKQQILARLDELKTKMISYFWYSLGGLFLLGLFFGCTMSGDGNPPPPAPKGLTNIVYNATKKGRLPVCGTVNPSNACVFYILNNLTIEKLAEDFYKDVAKLTGRQQRSIEIENVMYGKTTVRPGYFAEILVPVSR